LPRDAPSARLYAYVTPRLRALLPRLAGEDKVRDAIAQASVEDAAGVLRDTLYGPYIEAGPPWRIQTRLLEGFLETVKGLAKASPPAAREAALAFAREEEARDVFAALTMLRGGGQVELEMLPTSRVPGTILYGLRGEQEALASPQRLLEALRRTWLAPQVEALQRLDQEAGPTRAPALAASSAALAAHASALEGLDPRVGRRVASSILCPLLAWRAASIAVYARLQGLPPRVLELLVPPSPSCGFSGRRLRSVYEREQTMEGLLAGLRDELGVRLDPQAGPREALAGARREARRAAKAAALRAYAGYPFHGGLVVAGSTLARLEAQDLATVLTGIALRAKPEEYLPLTTYRLA